MTACLVSFNSDTNNCLSVREIYQSVIAVITQGTAASINAVLIIITNYLPFCVQCSTLNICGTVFSVTASSLLSHKMMPRKS